MKLLHLEIEHFGKLSGYSLDLRDGLNVICEKNGWGKSTLAVFIKAMLYGLPASTKRSLDRNERKKYTPWQGGSYGGSLEFSCEKGRFRVERFFAVKEANDEFRLFDLASNKPSGAFSSNLGEELLGIDADGFERSTYLSQCGSNVSEENVTITAKLTGLLEDVNDIGSFDTAMDIIDRRRKYYEVKGGKGKVSELTQELSVQTSRLDSCKGQLPEQDMLERDLAQCREHIGQTRQEIHDQRERLHRSDLQQAHRKEGERMQQRLRQTEERRKEILGLFRNQQLPTDGELASAKELLNSCRTKQAEQSTLKLTEAEEEALQRLERKYPNGVPSQSQLNLAQPLLARLSEAKAERNAAREIPDSQEQARFRRSGIPELSLLEEAQQKKSRAEQLQVQLRELAATPLPAPVRKVPLLFSFAALLAAASAGYAGFALTAYRIPLLIACCVLAAAGLLTLLLGGKKQDTAALHEREQKAEALEKELDPLLRFVRGVLERYGMPAQDTADLGSALSELRMLASRAHADRQRQEHQREQIRALDQRVDICRKEAEAHLRTLGLSCLPADPQAALMQIRGEIQEWQRLTEKNRELEKRFAEADLHLREMQSKLGAFLNRLTVRESRQPEECLTQMERLCQEHAYLLGEISRQRGELQQFLDQNLPSGTEQLPDSAELRGQVQTLENRLHTLQNEETEYTRRLDRISAQTEQIPELEDRCRQLTGELNTAKANLSTLLSTAKFLSASKDALSTRYLDGMQQYFTHYRMLLDGSETPAAHIDTSFGISVQDGGKSRDLESYSRGSRDVLQFCARLSLTKALFPEGEAPFLLLDDPFVNLDEDHIASARAMLDRLAPECQILYLVCHAGRA